MGQDLPRSTIFCLSATLDWVRIARGENCDSLVKVLGRKGRGSGKRGPIMAIACRLVRFRCLV
jgi:hypothetical protein